MRRKIYRNVNGRGLHDLLDLLYFFLFKKIKLFKLITMNITEEVLLQRRMGTSPRDWYDIQSKTLFRRKLFKIVGLCQLLKVNALLKGMFLKFIHKSII